MSAIFYNNDAQKRVALESLKRQQAERGKIATQVVPTTKFTIAEDYHQKYYLRSDRVLMNELAKYHWSEKDFVNSTAAARLNAYVGGHGTAAELKTELKTLGLSEEGARHVQQLVSK